MTGTTPRHVAIWIEDQQALLLVFGTDPVDRSTRHQPRDGWSQHLVKAQQARSVQEYCHAVLTHLGPQDEILLLGPGPFKYELRQQIEQQGGSKGLVVGLRQASRLDGVELVIPTVECRLPEAVDHPLVDAPLPEPNPGLFEKLRTLS
jgi:hypothetical protein